MGGLPKMRDLVEQGMSSAVTKPARQNRVIPKTRFDVMLWNRNYDFLCQIAFAEGKTMAAKLNEILTAMREKFHEER